MNFNLILAVLELLIGIFSASASKVIELSDRFLDLRGNTEWMIMFYAPWCGHCKRMEPVWSHVAQALYGTDIRVGRVDCTRFTGMSSSFKINSFPTVMYLKGDTQHVYSGDRNTKEIVGFALRMATDIVSGVDSNALKNIDEKTPIFLYVGKRDGDLWVSFYSLAKIYRFYNFFYMTDHDNAVKLFEEAEENAVYVLKDNRQFMFTDLHENVTTLNESMTSWINEERFGIYEKINYFNIRQMFKLEKALAFAVIEEDKTGNFTPEFREFRDFIADFASDNFVKYKQHFQFGWTGVPDVANSIAMEDLALPAFIVVNTSNTENYQFGQINAATDTKLIARFLDDIVERKGTSYGGNSYLMMIYRFFYTGKTTFVEVWYGNPILCAVLFGLPLGFLSLICYTIWCADILDANEDEEGESEETDQAENHHKVD